MDGYALRAADTHGASPALPAFLQVVGEAPMGSAVATEIGPGEAMIVHTGSMIPPGADAVVQVELTQPVGADGREIEVLKAAADGENVLQIGEDVRMGAEILPAGQRIRPQDIGALLALGLIEVNVAARPVVAIISTGDEVVPPESQPAPGQIRDINSYTVAAQTERAGAVPLLCGIVPDSFDALMAAAQAVLGKCDMLVISAGSSVSARDMTVQVIDGLGQPGVLFHGVATRPGKPTIVGVVEGGPVLGLPGNPVSAMVQFDMFGVPAIHHMQGAEGMPAQGTVWARLSQNLPSESGREDYVPAKLVQTAAGLVAQPVFGKSNLIFTLVNADGLIKVPLNQAGLPAGEWVEVRLF
jgi:molybdopterin molybdotransferase